MASFKQTLYYVINYSRSGILTFIIKTYIENIIIFINNAKTISKQLKPKAINASFLQPHFFVIKLIFDSNNIKQRKNKIKLSFLLKINSRFFFNKALENLLYL